MRVSPLVAAMLTLTLMSGCTSFRSTMINRLDGGSWIGNSNGTAKRDGAARHFKGIPITLEVPTHLEVFITETVYRKLNDQGQSVVWDEPLDVRLYNVRTNVIRTKQLFTVDFKRPAAGSLELTADMSDEQYFKKISSKLQDDTINQSAQLLSTVVRAVSTSAGGPTQDQLKKMPNVSREFRDVAYKRFDINAPDFEWAVECFVNEQLSKCHSCSSGATYDVNWE
jgi:hypothetical protein